MGEVGADTSLQVAGFAYINDRSRLVEVLVDTGIFWNGLEFERYAVNVFVDGLVYQEAGWLGWGKLCAGGVGGRAGG